MGERIQLWYAHSTHHTSPQAFQVYKQREAEKEGRLRCEHTLQILTASVKVPLIDCTIASIPCEPESLQSDKEL